MEINIDASDDLNQSLDNDIDLDNRDCRMEAEDDSKVNGEVSDIIRLYKYIQAYLCMKVTRAMFVCIFPICLSIHLFVNH